MSWNTIIGQERVTRLLRALWERGRLPHALLFHGPDGVGKEAVAIALARALNCARGTWDPCGVCESCRQMTALRHPNFHLLFALPAKPEEESALEKFSASELAEVNALIDAKAADPYLHLEYPGANTIKISSVRDLRRASSFRATGIGRPVALLCDAHRLTYGSNNAANAFLKTLEEPSGNMLIILATSQPDALLPTIRSRCQSVRFDPVPEQALRNALARDPDIPSENVDLACRLADGSVSAARDIAREGGLERREAVRYFLVAVVTGNAAEMHRRIQDYVGDDKREAERFLRSVAGWFRDVLALQSGAGDRLRNVDLAETLGRFHAHYPEVRCDEAVGQIERMIDLIRKNVHLSLVMTVLAQRLRRCIVPAGTTA
jgi:DNA polymerase III subunit delta'